MMSDENRLAKGPYTLKSIRKERCFCSPGQQGCYCSPEHLNAAWRAGRSSVLVVDPKFQARIDILADQVAQLVVKLAEAEKERDFWKDPSHRIVYRPVVSAKEERLKPPLSRETIDALRRIVAPNLPMGPFESSWVALLAELEYLRGRIQ